MSDASHNPTSDPTPSADRSNKRARSDRDADESKDNAEQSTQSSAHVSPVTRLYRHALESIFAFLKLADLSRVLSVSRSWSAAVRSTPSIGASVSRVPPSVIAASSLMCHIAELELSSQVVPDDLRALRRHFGSLRFLDYAIRLPKPQRVRGQRQQEARAEAAAIAQHQSAMDTLSKLARLTDLTVTFPSWLWQLDFSSLHAAASLRHLRLAAESDSQPTDSHIDELRSCEHLQTMDISGLDSESLGSLLRTPHQLQWQQISRVQVVDEVKSAALSCLPTLTVLEASSCSSVAFLQSLPRLRTLDLHVVFSRVSAEAVVAGLSCCPQLSSLRLIAPVTLSHMIAILSGLPLLIQLTLVDCFKVSKKSLETAVEARNPPLDFMYIDTKRRTSRLRS